VVVVGLCDGGEALFVFVEIDTPLVRYGSVFEYRHREPRIVDRTQTTGCDKESLARGVGDEVYHVVGGGDWNHESTCPLDDEKVAEVGELGYFVVDFGDFYHR